MNDCGVDWTAIATGEARQRLAALAAMRFSAHGNLEQWRHAVASLPVPGASDWDGAADAVRIGRAEDATEEQRAAIAAGLKTLIPWRKGPFDVFGIQIDTEWRSDWKWRRVLRAPIVWRDVRVLDIGCGSGYHLLRALGQGAACAVGVDPMAIFQMQFAALERLATPWRWPAVVLPARDADLPRNGIEFDVVLSMGVLYHHREPRAHVERLWQWTAPGGAVLLESIVVPQPEGLWPQGRYARMRNVRWVPSIGALRRLLEDAGFRDVVVVDRTATTPAEQRSTEWMPWESLEQALDPKDPERTIEGHPAPVRVLVVARRPRGTP